MKVGIDYSREHLDVNVREDDLIAVRQSAAARPLADPAAAMAEALEQPLGFPSLRRALTPDDHVAIIVDEQLPRLIELLPPVLDHVSRAGIAVNAITLLCPPAAMDQAWVGDLPVRYRSVRLRIHDPSDRKHLSYLATTAQGRRVYLNRTAVDADQLIVLARRDYDPLLGYGGAEGALYPALSDESTRQEMCGRLSLAVPGPKAWPIREEAAEVAWLLGAPFVIQVIEGAGEEIIHIIAGLVETSAQGQQLLDARWRATVDEPADTVIASMSGAPGRHRFADLARGLASASRVVKADGRIILLSGAAPPLGPGAEMIRQAGDPGQALSLLRDHTPSDMTAAFEWISAVQHARVYLLSGLPEETVEGLFGIPLEQAGQVQRLLDAAGSCIFLHDAHKTLAVASHRHVENHSLSAPLIGQSGQR